VSTLQHPVIDLHLHTTASDGNLAPSALVERAQAAGITILSVTDHDTVAGLAEARAAAARLGVTLVTGIEMTAVERGRDVHMLGYFFDGTSRDLSAFLERQRADRLRRVAEIGERLRELGVAVDVDALVTSGAARPERSIGRPQVADALVASGHVRDRREAFDTLLGDDCPAYVPRRGSGPAGVIAVVRAAGGIVSLAHPGLLGMDALVPVLAAEGLAAIEVRHSDHDEATERHYRALAARHGLAVSGGSDFHGEGLGRNAVIGAVTLSPEDFELLRARVP